MIKAVKKLKKKKRMKTHQYHEPFYHHPPSCHCCCSYPTTPAQPSAPTTPPWLEPKLTYKAISAHGAGVQPLPELVTKSLQKQVPCALPTTLSSYQRYLVPNPVYGGVPVEQKPMRDKSATFFGCVVNFGATTTRCFCPCFCIREASEIVVA
ncbi:hypothetical protein D5086_009575 [Populus alba]|uniref:Uncharacterized protein n=3 Tax=Populus TaxID=3689 RepID=A0ACC4CIS5_POPAL|nr:hypothetical protein NC653_012298 [Populus alba x Populus x berolinensis]TKR99421.1 hypothetical protein D5086_0000193070 [Populus alba]